MFTIRVVRATVKRLAALLISSTATNCMEPAYIKALMAADHRGP